MIGKLLMLPASVALYSSSIIMFADFPKDSILLPSDSLLISDAVVEQGVQSPTTTSFDVARLLLNPQPIKPVSSTSPTGLALQQLYKERKLQDDRLQQCQTVGRDWEQCFFYGTGTSTTTTGSSDQQQDYNNHAKLFLSPSPFDLPRDINEPKPKIPTW